MRHLPKLAVPIAAAVAALVLPGIAAAGPPDGSEPSVDALARFEELAAERGYELVDPVCVETEIELTFTCYASTTDGELFVATASLATDDVGWEILDEPGSAGAPGDSAAPATTEEPNSGPLSATTVTFDPLEFFAAVFSADSERLDGQLAWVQAGSPAEAYTQYQRRYVTTASANGREVTRSYVYLTTDGIRVCVTADQCSEITDIEVENEQLVSFTVDGKAIADRLGRPGEPVVVGSATVQLGVAYQTVTGGQLAAYIDILEPGGMTFQLDGAIYFDAGGTPTPVDAELSFGAASATPTGPATVMLAFPDAAPGGRIQILVTPADGTTPFAAEIPVVAFTDAPAGTDDETSAP